MSPVWWLFIGFVLGVWTYVVIVVLHEWRKGRRRRG